MTNIWPQETQKTEAPFTAQRGENMDEIVNGHSGRRGGRGGDSVDEYVGNW